MASGAAISRSLLLLGPTTYTSPSTKYVCLFFLPFFFFPAAFFPKLQHTYPIHLPFPRFLSLLCVCVCVAALFAQVECEWSRVFLTQKNVPASKPSSWRKGRSCLEDR